MVGGLQLGGLKAIQRIAGRIRAEQGSGRGARCRSTRQQQRDQIRRALEQAVETVIRFHDSASGFLRQEGHQDTTMTRQTQLNSTPVLDSGIGDRGALKAGAALQVGDGANAERRGEALMPTQAGCHQPMGMGLHGGQGAAADRCAAGVPIPKALGVDQ